MEPSGSQGHGGPQGAEGAHRSRPGVRLRRSARLLIWALALGSTILIVVGCLFPAADMPKIGASGVDKVIHFGMFFVWALAWLAALGEGYWRLSSVFVGGLILASATELAQGVLPWKRSPDFFDWGFDMAGVVLACAGWWVLGRLQIRKRRANSSADA